MLMRLHKRALALIITALCIVVAPGQSQEQGISDIQTVLDGCGFNPGPIDGLWGAKTAKAASDFVRAHGGSPVTDESSLMAQVDGFRIGDQGPCPADHEATGPAEVPEADPVRAEGSDSENSGDAKKILAEITAELDGKSGYRVWDDDETYSTEVKVTGETVSEAVKVSGSRDGWEGYAEINLADVESAYVDRGTVTLRCRESAGECTNYAHPSGGRSSYFRIEYSEVDIDIDVGKVVRLINQYVAAKQNDTPEPDPSTLKCIGWGDLGSISSGTWRNSYGKVSSSFKSGDLGKAFSEWEWANNYKVSHQHCLDNNERAKDKAIADMVLVGRLATEVDAEKVRIINYFQGKVKECQTEFTRRFQQYEGKFCQ